MLHIHDLDFALDGCGRLMEARGVRLSLENSGIPDVQYSVLRTLSIALAIAYTYLTLDRGEMAGCPTARPGLCDGRLWRCF